MKSQEEILESLADTYFSVLLNRIEKCNSIIEIHSRENRKYFYDGRISAYLECLSSDEVEQDAIAEAQYNKAIARFKATSIFKQLPPSQLVEFGIPGI